jgi:hypothetical protein
LTVDESACGPSLSRVLRTCATLKGYGRAAFIVRWWPAIIEKIKISKPGDRWRLPMNWAATDHQKMKPIKDPRIDDIEAIDTSELKQSDLNLSPISSGEQIRTGPGESTH